MNLSRMPGPPMPIRLLASRLPAWAAQPKRLQNHLPRQVVKQSDPPGLLRVLASPSRVLSIPFDEDPDR